jgi:plastocyanin
MCSLKFPVFCPAWLWLVVASSMLRMTTAQITIGPAVWTFNGPQDTTAEVGNVITFSWSGTHNVFTVIHPSGDCTETGAIQVGSTTDAAGASYTFTTADMGDVVFACDIATHCEDL